MLYYQSVEHTANDNLQLYLSYLITIPNTFNMIMFMGIRICGWMTRTWQSSKAAGPRLDDANAFLSRA
jgi:hypothetical protein